MKKVFTLIILVISLLNIASAQKSNVIDENSVEFKNPTTEIDETVKRGVPSAVLLWKKNDLEKIGDSYVIKVNNNIGYTCFGVGWKVDSKTNAETIPVDNFLISYKCVKNPSAKAANKVWGEFDENSDGNMPSETNTGYYWSDLMFGYDEQSRHDLFVKLTPPQGVKLSEIRIDMMNLSAEIDPSHAKKMIPNNDKSGLSIPTIIPRDDWCGSYTACHNASYTPTTINPTHVVIHHGDTPHTYTDGYAVVRSYWNYHVNTKHWADIGYNYLADKYGNLFQGRKNLNIPYSDVRGAHAGYSNSYSIGMNFLGHSDYTPPTAVQLDKVNHFLAWWFDHKNLDPTSSASIRLQGQYAGYAVKPRISGHKDVNPGGTECPGATLYAQLPSIRTNVKNIINGAGQTDVTAPTTSIANPGTWVTTNFTANFNDADNNGGSGVAQRFYQVLDYKNGEWRANKAEGFFNDNFASSINADWTAVTGNWTISNGKLKTNHESNSNTNIYTALTQSSGKSYVYNFKMKITGSGSNRRAGIHFFCNNTTRSNSYLVYFRADANTAQIYESVNGSLSLKKSVSCTVNAGTTYDVKIIYSTTTGKIDVYQSNKLVASWTDASPLTTAGYVSFRSGNCITEYDDFKVYKSRGNSATVTVGNSTSKQIRVQSANSTSYAGKILSLVVDNSNNISNVATLNQKVDFWGPYRISTVNDGNGSDINTQTNSGTISANWSATSDANNTISSYWYAIGTYAGGTNIVSWTNNGTSRSFSKSGLSLTVGTTYYVTVKAKNAAGLYSSTKSSNGVKIEAATVNYCTSKGGNTSYEWINKVVLGSINNTSGSNNGYGDFTNMSKSVSKGNTYTVTIYPAWGSGTYPEYYNAWIDYNHDGDFDDAGEQLFAQSATSASAVSKTFTIPNTATLGNTRMRIIMKYGGAPTSCGTYQWGETEDYTISIGSKSQPAIAKSVNSMNEVDLKTISIYPNPTRDILNVDLNDFEDNDVNVKIYSLTGAMVLDRKINKYSNSINVSHLHSGVYSVIILSEGKYYSKKFIKQ